MLRFEQVGFRYQETPETSSILEEVSFSLGKNDSLGIVGPCGSGKSTLGHLIAGVLEPVTGTIAWSDEAGRPANDRQPGVGYLHQNVEHQLIGTTVEEDLVFGLENLGLPREEMRARLELVRGFLGLEPWADRRVAELSDGEKQRLALGGMLVMEPAVVVLDEPTATLDPWTRQEFWQLIGRIRKEFSFSLVLITQDFSELAFVDRLLVLEAGRVKQYGGMTEIFEKYQKEWVAGGPFFRDLRFHLRMKT